MNSDNSKPNEATLADIYAAADRLKSVLLAGTASPECQALLDTIDACRAPYGPPSWFAKVQQAKREELSKFVQDRELKIMTDPEWMKEAADKVERLRSRLAELEGQEPAAASKYRRWDFEADDDGLLVCRGDHDNSEHCEPHTERLSPHEALQIVNEMRADLLHLSARTAPPAVPDELRVTVLELCAALENEDDLPPIKYALRCGRLVNEVKDMLAASPQREGGAE